VPNSAGLARTSRVPSALPGGRRNAMVNFKVLAPRVGYWVLVYERSADGL
jgi:hypothetical protein